MKQIPGVAWVALITALIGWLQGDWFAGEPWVPIVVVVLSAVVQLLNILVINREADLGLRAVGDRRGSVSRFFWGG